MPSTDTSPPFWMKPSHLPRSQVSHFIFAIWFPLLANNLWLQGEAYRTSGDYENLYVLMHRFSCLYINVIRKHNASSLKQYQRFAMSAVFFFVLNAPGWGNANFFSLVKGESGICRFIGFYWRWGRMPRFSFPFSSVATRAATFLKRFPFH